MADRDIHVPFGPDRTNGQGFEPLPSESEPANRDPLAEPALPSDAAVPAQAASSYSDAVEAPATIEVEPMAAPQSGEASEEERLTGGMTDEEAAAQGMDEMQMSILALKDSIGQGRELKARERDREELAEALLADREELADRDDILVNYHTIVAEQDAIVNTATQRREAQKAELAQITYDLDETETALQNMRAYHAQQLQPLETDLGRARATADQAKNDERSRKAEFAAAEKELSRADDNDANTMALARHRQTQSAYEEARRRSNSAKDHLEQAQRAYDDARAQAEQQEEPLERRIEDMQARSEALKESMNKLSDEISAARKRRQYCDNVYQYPDETAKMRQEIAEAEMVARKMDEDNEALRQQLAQSKQKARKAKIAIATVIVIIIVIIVAFIAVSNR